MNGKPKTKAALRNEEMWRKHHADCRELQRLHDLKPKQERFMIAIMRSKFDKVEEFLKSGEIDVNHIQAYGGYTAMHRATQFGGANMVQLLLEYGGDVHTTSNGGWSPLGHVLDETAMKPPDVERTVRALLLHGANVNVSGRKGCTPLQTAVLKARNSVVVKILLDHGADISKTDQRGYNALHYLSEREGAASVRNKICKTMFEHVQHDYRKMLRITGEFVYVDFDPDASDSDSDGEGNNLHTAEDLAEIYERPGLPELIHAAHMSAFRKHLELQRSRHAKQEARNAEDARQRKTAVAMSLHSRLGVDSEMSTLGTDIMGIIAKNM